jgi:hypothetical protein
MKKHAVIFTFVLLLSLVVATSTSAGGVYNSSFCVSQGGTWSGSDSLNGSCTYAANSAAALAACSADEDYVVTVTSGFPTGSACDSIFSGTPSSPEATCDAAGGSWSGSDSNTGTCTYDANSAAALFSCAADEELVEFYFSGAFHHGECNLVVSGSSSDSDSDEDADETKKETDKNSEGPVTLVLGGDKNGDVTFPPETCTQKCTISANLPGPAKNSIPGDAAGTIYVRLVDENGNPGTGTYLVCFNNPDGHPVIMYRFVGGAWVALTFASSSNRICVSASGDGAFYLGG